MSSPTKKTAPQALTAQKQGAAKRSTFRLILGVLLSFAAAAVFAWVYDQVKDKNRLTTGFDDALLFWMHRHQAPWLTTLAKVLAFMGSPPVIVSIAVVAALVGIFWRKVRGAAWTLPIAVIGAALIIQGVKMEFRRPRPTLFHPLLHETGYSFPSGHSLISIVIYGLLGYFIMHLFKARAARITVAILTVLLVLLVGLSRIYVGVHFPTDVLAGWTAGFPWLLTCLLIHEDLTRHFAGVGEPVLENPPPLVKAAARQT
jgi:undecaprenyl-diphosphatase